MKISLNPPNLFIRSQIFVIGMKNFADENFELSEVQKLEGHTDRVWSVAWKPTTGVPAVLASCSGDKTVRIWEESPATGRFQCKVF